MSNAEAKALFTPSLVQDKDDTETLIMTLPYDPFTGHESFYAVFLAVFVRESGYKFKFNFAKDSVIDDYLHTT